MYDITTTEGNFIAEGVIVHNCDSYYTVDRKCAEYYEGLWDYTVEGLFTAIIDAQKAKG